MNTRRFILSSTYTHTHIHTRTRTYDDPNNTRNDPPRLHRWISVCPFVMTRIGEKKRKKKKLKKRVGGRKREREIDQRNVERATVNTSESLKNSRPSYERVRERSFRSFVAHALFAMAHREFNRENALCTQEARKQHAPRISTLEIFSRKTRRECFWRLHSPIIAFIRYKPDKNLRARA